MGSIKKQRKKYLPPTHPWKRARIEEEKSLLESYGFANKKEIWKAEFILKKFKRQARKLIASTTKQGELEKKQMISKLMKYGLANDTTRSEDVLNLKASDIMDRRLQTLVYKKNLAKSIKQARQFIVHGHVLVSDNKVTVPSYLVLKEEEEKITFSTSSGLADPNHPERLRQSPEGEKTKDGEEKNNAEKKDAERPKRKPVIRQRKK